MTTKPTPTPIEAFSRLLDAYGADKKRWPEDARTEAEALIARDPAARRLLAEAQALDNVLGAGGAEPALDHQLAARIVAAALANEHSNSRAAPGPGLDSANVVPLRRSTGRPAQPITRRSNWQAAGLMAASLLAGLYLGGSGGMMPVIERIAEVTGLSLEADPVIALIGQEAGSQADEDFL